MKALYKNVYVIGVFDLFHRGHVEFLKKAKQLGQNLFVGVNSDAKVATYKREPVVSQVDRLEIVRACIFVNEAFIITDYAQKKYIEKYDIDAIIHGNDWGREKYLQQICVTDEYLKERNTELILIPYTAGISTSQIMNRIREMDKATSLNNATLL